jgi:hypothetical protein
LLTDSSKLKALAKALVEGKTSGEYEIVSRRYFKKTGARISHEPTNFKQVAGSPQDICSKAQAE